ncbi:MAG TPA: type I polyketide synthase, partial [Burkholderiales bacterium]|nr:type I polyketide synthase [Burkholderiales bacterium]
MELLPEPAELADAIAVIGLSCRFPDAANPAQFWVNLCNGYESSRKFTDDELRKAGSDPANRGKRNFVDRGILLADIDLFDAAFFEFNPRDADILDPQQRIFLECAWEALEDAGYDPSREDGLVGVFGGTDIPAYLLQLYNSPDILAAVGAFTLALANDKDHLTTRVAYKLNLKGPAVTVQTACSTSLVAVCQACKELLHYNCDLALAGGSGILMAQGGGYFWQEGGILSPDGHCRAFDAAAQGTIPGSGAGAVVLKRYEEAREDGDNIYAVIRGFGVNNDGSNKIGYTAPSVEGQAQVILNAITMAGIDPDTISYVEAHGTGTPLGDPIEIAALTQVFRRHTNRKRFCGIGSVKTNIGHLNSAAGIAGLIKTVLSLKYKTLPPSLNYERPNPRIDFDESPFFVVDRLRPWDNGTGNRRAAVSSFGMGGTNAHVILEEPPPVKSHASKRGWHVWLLSAKTAAALDRMSENLGAYVASQPTLNAGDVAYTLQVGRQAFPHRRALLVESVDSGPAQPVSAGEVQQTISAVAL